MTCHCCSCLDSSDLDCEVPEVGVFVVACGVLWFNGHGWQNDFSWVQKQNVDDVVGAKKFGGVTPSREN